MGRRRASFAAGCAGVALVALSGGGGTARAAPPYELPAPPTRVGAPAIGTPWTDAAGADHRVRDAQRRARESAGASPGRPPPPPAAPARDGIGAAASGEPADPATLDALRRQGERERDARQGRGGVLPAPMAVPRIQPDAPAEVPVRPPPRIAIPAPGEPGGPPIVLPSCGPAGCFDANGRPMPRVGGTDVLIGPGGRPCIQIGGAAAC